MKISRQYEELIQQLNVWEKLKESNASLSERIKLAHVEDHMAKMLQNHAGLTAHLIEEKVVISKEKKICLICRGEVLRFSYICECGALYCENCARALSNLENECWVCDIQIDSLKPVKHYAREDEKDSITVEKKKRKI